MTKTNLNESENSENFPSLNLSKRLFGTQLPSLRLPRKSRGKRFIIRYDWEEEYVEKALQSSSSKHYHEHSLSSNDQSSFSRISRPKSASSKRKMKSSHGERFENIKDPLEDLVKHSLDSSGTREDEESQKENTQGNFYRNNVTPQTNYEKDFHHKKRQGKPGLSTADENRMPSVLSDPTSLSIGKNQVLNGEKFKSFEKTLEIPNFGDERVLFGDLFHGSDPDILANFEANDVESQNLLDEFLS